MTTSKNNSRQKDILALFLVELERTLDTQEEGSTRALTKGQALIEKMVNGSLEGDQRMLANILKLMDKLDAQMENPILEPAPLPTNDWYELFAFYGKYKKLIDAEIRKLKKEHPDYWSFSWFKPTLATAPWYKDLYSK